MRAKYIILHHSATRDGNAFDWQAIRRFHKSWRYDGKIITEQEAHERIGRGEKGILSPWRDIGYHFGIEKINDFHEILIGRLFGEPGAHCRQNGMNAQSWGICFVGNYDEEEVLPEIWNFGLKLVKQLMMLGRIERENVKGHREFADYKSCPGSKFDLEKFWGEL